MGVRAAAPRRRAGRPAWAARSLLHESLSPAHSSPFRFPPPSPRSRSKLPRGVWPKNSKGEQVKFKIVPKAGYVGLPLAHTCFFLLECGTGYTSYEAMRRSFVTAILYGASEGFLIQ